jgi:hypothetical protein
MDRSPDVHTFTIGVDRRHAMDHKNVETLLKGNIIRVHGESKRTITIDTNLTKRGLSARLSSIKGLVIEGPAIVELL